MSSSSTCCNSKKKTTRSFIFKIHCICNELRIRVRGKGRGYEDIEQRRPCSVTMATPLTYNHYFNDAFRGWSPLKDGQ